MIDEITPLLITYNEAANIGRTLEKLTWASRIVVIDSGSTDKTLEIVRKYPQAEIIQRPFDDFAAQCNFGLAQVKTEWVLSLDADYELSDKLVAELYDLRPDAEISGYCARFIYRVSWSPSAWRTLSAPHRAISERKCVLSQRRTWSSCHGAGEDSAACQHGFP